MIARDKPFLTISFLCVNITLHRHLVTVTTAVKL